MTVDKSQSRLRINLDINGTVVVKAIRPNDVVVVEESYEGNSFDWSPSSGPNGTYRYDVRVIEQSNMEIKKLPNQQNILSNSDYAGGNVEVKNGQIENPQETVQ